MCLRLLILLAAVLMTGAGCSKKQAPDPPSARAELTVRLFETLNDKRYEETLVIIDKLLALDSNDADLMEMRDRVVGNIAAAKIQNFINNNELEKAHRYIRYERKLYPVMPRLRLLEEEVENLIALSDAAQKLAAARTIPELTAALDRIVPIAAKYPKAELLHKDIARRKDELKKMRIAAARAVEKAAAGVTVQSAPVSGNSKP